MVYLPDTFRTIFKTTQNPTMPTIKVATAVNTVVAVLVMVEGSANVVPLPWAWAEAAPMAVAATRASPLLILFLTVCIFPFGCPQPLRRIARAGNKRSGKFTFAGQPAKVLRCYLVTTPTMRPRARSLVPKAANSRMPRLMTLSCSLPA